MGSLNQSLWTLLLWCLLLAAFLIFTFSTLSTIVWLSKVEHHHHHHPTRSKWLPSDKTTRPSLPFHSPCFAGLYIWLNFISSSSKLYSQFTVQKFDLAIHNQWRVIYVAHMCMLHLYWIGGLVLLHVRWVWTHRGEGFVKDSVNHTTSTFASGFVADLCTSWVLDWAPSTMDWRPWPSPSPWNGRARTRSFTCILCLTCLYPASPTTNSSV